MNCPICGAKTTVVFTEKQESAYVRRVRYCPKCKRAWNSTELYDEREEAQYAARA